MTHATPPVAPDPAEPAASSRAAKVATIPALTDVVAMVAAGEPVPPELRRQGTGTVEDVTPPVVYGLAAQIAARRRASGSSASEHG